MKALLNRIIFLISIIIAVHAYAGTPQVSQIMTTDVTTKSFSVIWISSEPAMAALKVFNGPDCVTPSGTAVITAYPILSGASTIQTAAKNRGIVKVMVTGLLPDTEYCYQTVTTSESTSEQIISPDVPVKVTTEKRTISDHQVSSNRFPIANDVIAYPVYDKDFLTPAAGGILVVDLVDVGSYPATGFVGDGVVLPNSIVDLNNIFSSSDRQNMRLAGDERIKLIEYRGSGGCTLVQYRKVPLNSGINKILQPDACFNTSDLDCDNQVDIGDVILTMNGLGNSTGDNCFNPDLDQDKNNTVNMEDIGIVSGKYGTTR
jgi:chitodextrinase